MSETNKTLIFVVVAAATLGAAWFGRPQPIGMDMPDQVGQVLFPDFKDPYDAKNMQVVEYEPELGDFREFEVAQKNGLWVIPSHQDYPADAEENLAAAANLLVDLKVINVVSDQVTEHATYGVIRPSRDKVQAGDKGVGKLVSFRDAKGNRLAEVVIGKEVPGKSDQRFVRSGDQERVYIVKLDDSKLSTEFKDWVKRDILDLNAFDVRDITIHDYSANPKLTNQGVVLSEEDRLRMSVRWDADNAKWILDSLEEFAGDKMRPSALMENEELDNEKLNDLKRALDDLQIVDVERKPTGLGAGLKANEDFWSDNEGINSLFERGFYAARTPDGEGRLLSSNGEITIHTTDGIEYVLRFGSIAGIETGQQPKQEDAKEAAEESAGTESSETGLNRFVMVTASVFDAAFEKPKLDLPEPPAAKTNEEPQDDSEAKPPQDDEQADAENPATDANPSDQESASGETADSETAGSESSPKVSPDDKTSATDTAEDKTAETAAKTESPLSEEAEAERDAKIKEYEREKSAYEEKVNKAREKVDKLNFRFADWYYVISEDEYRKIHLGRPEIIKVKEATAEQGDDINSFRKLQDEGLRKNEEQGGANSETGG